MMGQLVTAVDSLHSKGLAHNDLKLLNVLRIENDQERRLYIIDFDAATSLERHRELLCFIGAKVSSATLPPEMFAKLNTDEVATYERYFETGDPELLSKIAPKRLPDGQHMVVRTFLSDPEDSSQPFARETLPYELVESSEASDIWALGCVLYLLMTGESLEKVNRDDDLTDAESMERIMTWNDKQLNRKLQAVKDVAARDLIDKLLQPDPANRLRVAEALEHPFFNADSSSLLQRLKDAKEREAELKAQLEALQQNQGNGAAEATAAVMQALVDIQAQQKDMKAALTTNSDVGLKILANTERIDAGMKVLDERTRVILGVALEIKYELARRFEEMARRLTATLEDNHPTVFVIIPTPEDPSDAEQLLNDAAEAKKAAKEKRVFKMSAKVVKFGNRAVASTVKLCEKVSSTAKNPFRATKKALMDLLSQDNYCMYLLCELCFAPQSSATDGGPWPVIIAKASDRTKEVAAMLVRDRRTPLRCSHVSCVSYSH